VLESLTDYVSGSPWTYAYLFAVSALDVVFPVVPSEASVIAGGVVAGTGGLLIWAVILCAASGAILGDNVSYWIGRTLGERIVERFFQGDRRKRIDWAERQIVERGGYLIVVGRFIPGGRTAVTLAAGLLEMPWRRFIAFDVAAGILWATYAGLLGYFGGRAFESPLRGLVIAFAIALAVTGLIEFVRWLRKRRVVAGG
jgi:membrane-associated protein